MPTHTPWRRRRSSAADWSQRPEGGWVRRRLGWWLLVAVLATGCTTSDANQRQGSDQTDVWFAQHMVPHLLQNSAIVSLAGDQLTRPKLVRLADTINRQSHADLQQL